MIKAVFFDVDGTLVSHTKKEVSASTRRALQKLKEKNIQCVLATGRHIIELEMLPVRDIAFDGYVMLNGQLCLDAQKKKICADPIAGADLEYLLEKFHAAEVPVLLVEEDRHYLNFVNRRVEDAQADISSDVPETGSYTGRELYQVVVFIGKEDEDALAAQVPNCKVTRWNERAVDIIAGSGGKDVGIRRYLQNFDIAREEIMAFGDGENDIEMLEYAGIGVAMGNAEDAVKACADYVTASVDDEGIEKALKHFGIID